MTGRPVTQAAQTPAAAGGAGLPPLTAADRALALELAGLDYASAGAVLRQAEAIALDMEACAPDLRPFYGCVFRLARQARAYRVVMGSKALSDPAADLAERLAAMKVFFDFVAGKLRSTEARR